MQPTVTIDASGLNEALAECLKWSTKAPAATANYAAYYVAKGAFYGTKKIEVATVDADLSVLELPVIGKRGKPLKGKRQFAAGLGGSRLVPLAVLIIQARARAGSRYNQLTGGRYRLPQSPFKGVSRAAGAFAMRAAVDRMVKQRHSSTGFIRAGWLPAIKTLGAIVGDAGGMMDRATSLGLGAAIPAASGSAQARCVIANDVGLSGSNSHSNNRALIDKGSGPLQAAIDAQGQKEMAYAMRKHGEALERKIAELSK